LEGFDFEFVAMKPRLRLDPREPGPDLRVNLSQAFGKNTVAPRFSLDRESVDPT
jgi:hypothetical protein